MKNNLIIKKCNKCGAIVKVLKDCSCADCGINCCGEEMKVLIPNSVDASVEKHVPNYKIDNDEIIVNVNHVMEKDHFIEWISLINENVEYTIKLSPMQTAEAKFPYLKNSVIYAYCNKHGLWKIDVD